MHHHLVGDEWEATSTYINTFYNFHIGYDTVRAMWMVLVRGWLEALSQTFPALQCKTMQIEYKSRITSQMDCQRVCATQSGIRASGARTEIH